MMPFPLRNCSIHLPINMVESIAAAVLGSIGNVNMSRSALLRPSMALLSLINGPSIANGMVILG